MATGLGNIAAFSLVTPLSDLHKWNKGIANTARGFDRLNSSALNFKAIIGGGLLIGAAKNAFNLADTYQVLSRRIATASDSIADFEGNMDSMVSTAMQTGTALNTNVKLFQDLKRAGLGTSQEIRTLGSAVAQMGVLSGSTTEDMKFGLRQLSQGLSAGVFRAEEFNSVQENTPEIMKQIRIGLGKTQGQLRQMVLDGKLLSEDVFRVLVERADEVAAAFAKIPPDMARGIEATKTGMTVFFGQIDKGLRVTRTLAQAAFDFGNFLAADSTLEAALKSIAAFKVYFKNFIYEPAREAFTFVREGFTTLSNATSGGLSGFIKAAQDINQARDSLSSFGKVALVVGGLLASNLVGPILGVGAAALKVAGVLSGVLSPATMIIVKTFGMLAPAAGKAASGFMMLVRSFSFILAPIGVFISLIGAAVGALGYFAGKSANTGSIFTDTWVGILAVIATVQDRIGKAFTSISKFAEMLGAAFDDYFEDIIPDWLIEKLSWVATKFGQYIGAMMNSWMALVDTVRLGGMIIWTAIKKAFTFGDESLLEEQMSGLVADIKQSTDIIGAFNDGWNNFTWDGAVDNFKRSAAQVKDVLSNLRFDPSAVVTDEFWADVTANAKRIGATKGKEAGIGWVDELINGIKAKFGDLSPEVEKEFEKLMANVKEAPMEITAEDLLPTGFDDAGEKKASEFMQGYTSAFEAFGKSTSQMMTDSLFGDSSISFKEIARKLVKDLLTNTIHFLLVSPLVKSMQALMGSIFTLPDGTNPFDNLSNAANGVAATKKTPGQSAGGISAIISGIGGVLGMFGGGSSAASAVGSLTSSFLQPSTDGLLQSNFADNGMTSGPSQNFNNYFNIAANEPASFMEARGRIGNQITRTQRNS